MIADGLLRGLGLRRPPTILVIGDLMCDRFVWGEVERVSPEAPIPVLRVQRESERPGGAANVAMNLAALGCRVRVAGVVGKDAAGRRLLRILRSRGIGTDGIVASAVRPTTVKVRAIARGRQLIRMDHEARDPLTAAEQRQLGAAVTRAMTGAAAVVCSDYAKGVLTRAVLRGVLAAARRRRRAGARRPVVVVDPKGRDFLKYRGADILTPNEDELREATEPAGGLPGRADLPRRAYRVMRATGIPALLVTRGAAGMELIERRARRIRRTHVPASQRHAVHDATGAGDTVVAVVALAASAGLPLADAARMASAAAGLVVRTVGAAVVDGESLRRVLDGTPSAARSKILSRASLAARVREARRRGLTVVLTNGCFDLLHAGHLHLLQRARALGDVLVVAVNDDRSVRRLKGPDRPLVSAEKRVEALAALGCVDFVTVFREESPLALVRLLRPDVLVKGGDYTLPRVVGRNVVESRGGRVELVPLLPGFSTSGLVESIRRRQRSRGRGS